MGEVNDRWAFTATWQDPRTKVKWDFTLFWYPATEDVELHDMRNRRTYLKRIKCPTVTEKALFIDGIVPIFGRAVRLTGYADAYTKRVLGARQERTLTLVKPDGMPNVGKIIDRIIREGLQITNIRTFQFDDAAVHQFYAAHVGKPFFPDLLGLMTSGRGLAVELVGRDAVATWRQLMGPTDAEQARKVAPASIRALYGSTATFNAVHGSDTAEAAAVERNLMFGANPLGWIALHPGSSLCLVKPHALTAGQLGSILTDLQRHFVILNIGMAQLTHNAAERFYEVYRAVWGPKRFLEQVEQVSSGQCAFVELSLPPTSPHSADGSVNCLRHVCGPMEPASARLLRPGSIRARYGLTDGVHNAVHCTDLEDDAPLELDFFFGPNAKHNFVVPGKQ